MRNSPPDLSVALRVWWAYTWRFAVAFMVPAMLVVPALLYILQPPQFFRALTSLAIFAYMIWLQIELFRRILAMDFGTFRVRVEPSE